MRSLVLENVNNSETLNFINKLSKIFTKFAREKSPICTEVKGGAIKARGPRFLMII